ncbi:transcriptional activator spt7 [Grosmannia clavigera kw1407]|uniref:Transcriptional activator spt7 n=1 Tax=Grosmannia clavigera (strain kw1407 / UAMH 11150) TaxID=655863 RepID=F0XNB6_GROCL|nr:transcriptional activator spt7 [Grosmannia clavigera kw1407]EFX00934.1 transcriptional activator spt7 [Grosmannia clavigera kw1407]
MFPGADDAPARTQTPTIASDNTIVPLLPEAPTTDLEDDARRATFSDLYRKSEARVALLFSEDGRYNRDAIRGLLYPSRTHNGLLPPPATDHTPIHEPPYKKTKRTIDEDDYDDDDDDEEAAEDGSGGGAKADGSAAAEKDAVPGPGPLAGGPPRQLLSPSKSGSSPVHSVGSPDKQNGRTAHEDGPTSQPQQQLAAKTSEDVRKELEAARNATEVAARRSFHTLFYTLENDRTAMLEQQQLEESEKQIQAEMEKHGASSTNGTGGQSHGTLSSANLGASSLTLKHLIARIDLKRDQVKATDTELRSLINEVRKNRSKWASEEHVGQEELYEALEKVLSELKAHTEYSTPFLQRVNKREAPDYHIYVKQPMDLGTMTKKLKGLQFKSKAEFVADLNLVWDNCLKYNRDMGHPLRRMANSMRKEAEKLIPLIPDLTIRSRAEVEAEERRKQNGGDDGGDDDSDDEPIMSSRGRTAGTKGVGTKSRGAATMSATMHEHAKEGTPGIDRDRDRKPVLQLNGLLAKSVGGNNSNGREGSEAGDGSIGFGTPLMGAVGSVTPGGLNGGHHSGVGSNVDAMDLDGSTLNGLGGLALDRAINEAAEQVYEDEEDLTWKQVTKKSRALLARQRYDMFRDGRLNIDQPALLRTKADMRWYVRGVKEAEAMGLLGPSAGRGGGGGADSMAAASSSLLATADSSNSNSNGNGNGNGLLLSSSSSKANETTLAEGMEDDVEKVVPDYYEPQSIVPDVPLRLQWIEDDEGGVINPNEEFLRLVPEGHFVAPPSRLSKRFDENMRQIQETRKICSKIGVVKQMQIQTQFQRYDPEPFFEADIERQFVCGDGAFMVGETCRAAMQRSVAKIFFHAGFEELQPSAMEAMTDIAADYFMKLCHTMNVYNEAERKEATGAWAARGARFQPRYTPEEVVLHTLHENGHDLDGLDSYVRDDVERLGAKLGAIHERMKAHLGDLLRPALQDGGTEAFNDGSEQFVGGDFAEELGEDFFGFKALGLDKELGLDILSVPLHLLQTRVRNQSTNDAPTGVASEAAFEAPPPLEPVTRTSIGDEIGLIKNFFLAKLHANGDQPLVEDEDLPVKQRRPRPRLGATGKIVSPQKRPPKEQIALAKKKKREAMQAAAAAAAAAGAGAEKTSPSKKNKAAAVFASSSAAAAKTNGSRLTNGLGPDPPGGGDASSARRDSTMSQVNGTQAEEKDGMGGPMSPESIAR